MPVAEIAPGFPVTARHTVPVSYREGKCAGAGEGTFKCSQRLQDLQNHAIILANNYLTLLSP